jgi:hypothetical protein
MINTKQIFKEFSSFIEKLEIEERQFIDDENSLSNKFITSALNGLHTEEAVKIAVDCLFQRGFNNFKQHAKQIIKEDGISKLNTTMSFMAGELITIFKNVKIRSIPFAPISFSEMQTQLNSQDYLDWKSAVKDGVTTPTLMNTFNTVVENAIKNFPDRAKEIIREFSSELNKGEFKVDNDFMKMHGLDLYNMLIASGEMKGEYEDFKLMCRGLNPIEKLKFKKASSLGTFIKELVELSKLSLKNNYWTFLAHDACEEFTKEFKAEHLRSNLKASKNPKVSTIFGKFHQKIKKANP